MSASFQPPSFQPAGRVAVIQPLPGIGDTVWHLPHLHAIAACTPAGRVTLVTKPRSAADALLAADPTIEGVIWYDGNPKGRRGRHDGMGGFLRFVGDLRAARFDTVVILHRSWRYALAARAAGIPDRYGYGIGRQRWFLNRGPRLDAGWAKRHPIEIATGFLERAGCAVTEPEPRLAMDQAALSAVSQRHTQQRPSWVTIGLGSSECGIL